MNKALRFLLAIVILAVGIGTASYMVKTKPVAKRSPSSNPGTAVEIIEVAKGNSKVTVRARGTVMPARQVVLGPEVGGQVIQIAEELQPGGRFKAGETILRIDPSDYKLAVEQQFAAVDSAQTQLELEQSRKAVAQREWDMFGGKQENANRALALREPQMRSANVNLKSAKSGLRRAKLSVGRTFLRAPFDGQVQGRQVELGQMVAPGSPLLTFVGTRAYWVQVSIPVERLAWISVPGVDGKAEGSNAIVRQKVGDQELIRKGKVLRLLADVDPAGRMARVLVQIDDPLGLHGNEENAKSPIPLLLGSYVDVAIEGKEAEGVFEIARTALRQGSTVYVMKPDDTLEIRDVKVLWRQQESVLVDEGLKPGDRLIVSPLASAMSGMKLRLPGAKPVPKTSPLEPKKEPKKELSPPAEPSGASSENKSSEDAKGEGEAS